VPIRVIRRSDRLQEGGIVADAASACAFRAPRGKVPRLPHGLPRAGTTYRARPAMPLRTGARRRQTVTMGIN